MVRETRSVGLVSVHGSDEVVCDRAGDLSWRCVELSCIVRN